MRRPRGFLARIVALAALALLVPLVIGWIARPALAETQRRVALVIGNGAYTSVPALPNPTGDARAVAAALRRLGFEVTDGYDLSIADMRARIAAFSATLPNASAAIIYYAGHGVAIDGENFLVPVDMVLKGPADFDLEAISMSLLLKQLKREERVNIIILDACRDNPFAGDLAHAQTRAVVGDRGLNAVNSDLAKGTLIAYASDPNSTALDGKPGEASPFTKALLHHLEDPDIPIGTVMDRVRTEVWDETRNRQMPWVNTSLIGEFVLNPQVASLPPAAAAPAPATLTTKASAADGDRFALENRLWDSAEHGNTAGDYQAYLASYPTGLYAQMARTRIVKLTPVEVKPPTPGGPDPAGAAAAAMRGEVGTEQTEAALDLDLEQRRQVQARLAALSFDAGGATGTFGLKARSAIVGWQKNHGAQPTGWLGPLAYAALKTETESSYRDFLVAAPAEGHHWRHIAQSRSLEPVRRHAYRARYAGQRAQPRYGTPSGGLDPAGAALIGGMLGGVIGRFR